MKILIGETEIECQESILNNSFLSDSDILEKSSAGFLDAVLDAAKSGIKDIDAECCFVVDSISAKDGIFTLGIKNGDNISGVAEVETLPEWLGIGSIVKLNLTRSE